MSPGRFHQYLPLGQYDIAPWTNVPEAIDPGAVKTQTDPESIDPGTKAPGADTSKLSLGQERGTKRTSAIFSRIMRIMLLNHCS